MTCYNVVYFVRPFRTESHKHSGDFHHVRCNCNSTYAFIFHPPSTFAHTSVLIYDNKSFIHFPKTNGKYCISKHRCVKWMQHKTHVTKSLVHSNNFTMLTVYPDNEVHGAIMGPIWGRLEPGDPMLAPLTLLNQHTNLIQQHWLNGVPFLKYNIKWIFGSTFIFTCNIVVERLCLFDSHCPSFCLAVRQSAKQTPRLSVCGRISVLCITTTVNWPHSLQFWYGYSCGRPRAGRIFSGRKRSPCYSYDKYVHDAKIICNWDSLHVYFIYEGNPSRVRTDLIINGKFLLIWMIAYHR